MAKERKQMVRVSFKERAHIWELLQEHCRKTEDGYAEFERGWNDEEVAQLANADLHGETDGPINKGHVQTIRKEMIGNLAPTVPLPRNSTSFDPEIGKRIAEMEAEFDKLGELVHNLQLVIGSQNRKIENLQHAVSQTTIKLVSRQDNANKVLRGLLANGAAWEQGELLKRFCAEGFDEHDLQSAMVLVGATLKRNSTGTKVVLNGD